MIPRVSGVKGSRSLAARMCSSIGVLPTRDSDTLRRREWGKIVSVRRSELGRGASFTLAPSRSKDEAEAA
jgi:hypothetical protein